jgi:hypothetical protein
MKLILSSLLFVLLVITSCGKKELDVDTTPFNKAITAFLKKSHMDLKVTTFQKIKVQDENAEATCGLKYITGAGPAVRWKFYFEKNDDDQWQVNKYEQNK